MNRSLRLFLSISILFVLNHCAYTQDTNIDQAYKENVITVLCQHMNDYYIFPEVAKETEKHLLNQLGKGHFNNIKTDESFAEALTSSVQSINKDKHMRIMVNPPYEEPENSPERMIEEKIYNMNRSRKFNSGLNSVKVMEGNVGYLDLRGFAGMESGKDVADAYMKLLSRTDAVIVDLRKNGGGSPSMVQYLCSFFFDEKLHLNSLYYREGNVTKEYWTLEEVGGTKMPEVPLFVLTSDRTFSGAEEFSYNMQTQKRATLIGQTTGGGANPGGTRPINENLRVFIPTGKAINPITKTNWEGVGVVPELVTSIEETMDKSYELAKIAAEKYRTQKKNSFTKTFIALHNKLDNYKQGSSSTEIVASIKNCSDSNILQEWDINGIGYEFLMQKNNPAAAELIFKTNTELHPDSPNVFDSYAECLLAKGDVKGSIYNYQKALDLSIKNEDGEDAFYKENLAKAKDALKAMKK